MSYHARGTFCHSAVSQQPPDGSHHLVGPLVLLGRVGTRTGPPEQSVNGPGGAVVARLRLVPNCADAAAVRHLEEDAASENVSRWHVDAN